MARKKKHEEHENHERWLISYADFITLLFAFFVVMYSISAINEGKFRILSEALVAAFRSQPKALEPVQVGKPAKAAVDQQQPVNSPIPGMAANNPPTPAAPVEEPVKVRAIKRMAEEIERAMQPLIKADLLVVRRDNLWLEVEIKASILFTSGSARLAPRALPVLRKIAGILAPYPNPIHIEGFTDNKPINTVAFPSNWELSAARAASVVHLFGGAGIKPERMAAIGFGEYRPVADNKEETGRSKNRRVVLVVLADEEKHLPAPTAVVSKASEPPPDSSPALAQPQADKKPPVLQPALPAKTDTSKTNPAKTDAAETDSPAAQPDKPAVDSPAVVTPIRLAPPIPAISRGDKLPTTKPAAPLAPKKNAQ